MSLEISAESFQGSSNNNEPSQVEVRSSFVRDVEGRSRNTEDGKEHWVEFPSGIKLPKVENSYHTQFPLVHLFGGLTLPLNTDIQTAFRYVTDLARARGFVAKQDNPASFKVWGRNPYSGFLIEYSDKGLLNVSLLQEPASLSLAVNASLPAKR